MRPATTRAANNAANSLLILPVLRTAISAYLCARPLEIARVRRMGRSKAEQQMNTTSKQPGIGSAIVPQRHLGFLQRAAILCTPNSRNARLFPLGLILGLAGFIPGCQYPSSAAMTGTWAFTLTSANSPVIIVTASLSQSGNQISGPLNLNCGNSACGTQGTITGNIQGTSLTLQIAQFQSQAFLNGTTNQAFTSATGTYTTGGAGSCFGSGNFGSWSAFFQ